MSISSLFKSGNLDEIKPKLSNIPTPLVVSTSEQTTTPIPVAQLFLLNNDAPVKSSESKSVDSKVKEIIVERIVEVPKEIIIEKIVRDESALLHAQVELEQVKSLNGKYLQVINQINEELMTVKANEGKNSAVAVDAVKEKEVLVAKIEELTKALVNVINQNKLLSRALGMRS
jgi:hypothetical protein